MRNKFGFNQRYYNDNSYFESRLAIGDLRKLHMVERKLHMVERKLGGKVMFLLKNHTTCRLSKTIMVLSNVSTLLKMLLENIQKL